MNGMQLWRPLLGVDKTSLRAWLEKRRLEPIEDRTNLDPRYLRARMRTAILPELERHFGKEVSENLRRLGDAAKELGDYLARQVQKYEEQVVEDREEKRVNLSGFYPFEPLEIKIFLKTMFFFPMQPSNLSMKFLKKASFIGRLAAKADGLRFADDLLQ
jgi:tRNA(Ile)-lysidine synthase TilS/MesJ